MTRAAGAEAGAGLLEAAVERLNVGDLAGAAQRLERALAFDPADPAANTLLGVVHLERGALAEAEAALRLALSVDPRQPLIHHHLGRTMRAAGRPGEAIAFAGRALTMAPGDPDLSFELALAQEDAGASADALASYRAVLLGAPDHDEAARRLAAILSRTGRRDEAETVLRASLAALDAARGDANARAGVALDLAALLKSRRRHDEAIAMLDRAAALAPDLREVQPRRAIVLQHLRRYDEAIEAMRSALVDDPLDLDMHVRLNELLHRQARDDQFLRSYDIASAAAPSSPLPLIAKGQVLLKLGRFDEARESYARALAMAPGDAAALTGQARALEAAGESAAAEAAHRSNLLRGNDLASLVEGGSFFLRRGDAGEARALAERAHAAFPLNQEALALLGLCHRAAGDDETEHALNGYDSLVRVFDLDPPPGFADMADFNAELGAALDALHDDQREYFTQTLRGGTRLFDDMFDNGHALVDRLRERIDAAVIDYIRTLPPDAAHPFIARRSDRAVYAGSWSSRMSDRGFHVNHLHPAGWISSAYYVTVPETSADAARREGWLKFGEPTDDFGDAFAPRRFVQPMPGRLVLFPSYLWHGTTPYRSPQQRMTIAFDVIP